MPKTWLQIRVDLLSGRGEDLDPTPGRVFICGPDHTFAELADAINQAFARWDISHLHVFELPNGRRIGFPDEEIGPSSGPEDQARLRPIDVLEHGQEFAFTFDFGDDWRHRCRVLDERLDPESEWGPGPPPPTPVPISGWGSIPDQYGLDSADELV